MKRYFQFPCCSAQAYARAPGLPADMQHVEAWSKMLAASNPPIDSTPITPFLEEHAFRSKCLFVSRPRLALHPFPEECVIRVPLAPQG